jgi:hypothetical protein
LKAGGLPILCHPAWSWAFDADVAVGLNNVSLFEVCNALPVCNGVPIPGYAPVEQMWDVLLSSGHVFYGLGNDDGHLYWGRFNPRAHYAGRGWTCVWADRLEVQSVMGALQMGASYASTGVEIKDHYVRDGSIHIAIEPWKKEVASFEFLGKHGRLLQHSFGSEARYGIAGDELYIRVRIASTNGSWAWTQPVFVDSPESFAWLA